MNSTDDILRLRHRLHALAELSGQEEATAAFVFEQLSTCQPASLLTGLGGYGVLAEFPGTRSGPTILLRAELDALPLDETLDLDHASFSPGVAHKCGHDGHMAILLGVAARLRRDPPECGRVLLLFQPAEETGNGAAAVLTDPRLAAFTPDWVFALHNLPGYPLHTVVLAPGPFCAASAGIEITLTGKSSHAAYPEAGISPDRAMARLVLELINLPDSLPEPGGSALVTVVHSCLGRPAYGIAPSQAKILATLRASRPPVLELLKQAARDRVRTVAQAESLDWSTVFQEEFPAVVNAPAAVEVVNKAARELGLATAEPQESPFRWSEDFGHLMVPDRSALLGLGSGCHHPVLHAGDYDFCDALLPTGINLLAVICRQLTTPKSGQINPT